MTSIKKRPIIASITATALAFSIFIFSSVVGADATYPKAYTMGNVLTDYQYFVREDFNASGHIVGSIAIGGTINYTNYFGEGIIAPSFVNNIENINLASSTFTSDDKTIYYGTNSSSLSLSEEFIQNSNYIDMDTAFNALINESVIISNRATKTYTADDIEYNIAPKFYGMSAININLAELEQNGEVNVNIPYSVFNAIALVHISGFEDASYFQNNKVFISVTGVGDDEIPHLNFNYPNPSSYTSVAWNGTEHETHFVDSMPGGEFGNQINLNGMQLVWNFPDANQLDITALNGHLFAPNADLSIMGGGRHEGGMIVNRVIRDNNSEAHYYPYYNPRTGFEEDPEETTAPSTTTTQSENTTAPTTTSQGENTTAPTTTSQGENTTAPATTSQGENTTAPTTTSQGENTTAPTTTSQGENTTAPTTADNSNSSTTSGDENGLNAGTGDSNSTGDGTDGDNGTAGGSGDSSDNGNGTNTIGGGDSSDGTLTGGSESTNPDSGTGSLIGFTTATFLVAITLSVVTRKKKDD